VELLISETNRNV